MFHSKGVNTMAMTVSERLQKARDTKARMKEQGIKVTKRTLVQIWEEDKTSLRKSINAKCWDCCHGDKESIMHCTIKACPLWYVRPYKSEEN